MIKSKEELIKKMSAADFIPAKARQMMLAHIEKSEFGQDLLFWVEDRLQDLIDKDFAQMGITIDEHDPDYKAAQQKMAKAMDAADKTFANKMSQLQKTAQKIISNTSEKIDASQLQALRGQMRSGS